MINFLQIKLFGKFFLSLQITTPIVNIYLKRHLALEYSQMHLKSIYLICKKNIKACHILQKVSSLHRKPTTMKYLFICVAFLGCTLIAKGQQVNNYKINVEFFPEDAQMWGYPVSNTSFMRGNTTVDFKTYNKTLTFYLHGELKVDSITSGKKSLDFNSEKVFYDNDYSLVATKTTLNTLTDNTEVPLTIYYSGFMNPSSARSTSDYMRIQKDEGVFLRAHYYSAWFPIFLDPEQDDYKANFESVTVTLPKHFKAVVAGELVSETVNNSHYTAVWKPGISEMFEIQCTARPFKQLSKDNLFVNYVGNKANAERIITFAQQLKELYYSKLKNVHSTASLHIVEMPKYGNISSKNVIGISTDVYNNFSKEFFAKSTLAHELVHPYTEIPVANTSPFAALVIEGFPSFFHLYGMNSVLSKDDFNIHNYMLRVEASYVKKKRTGKDRRGNKLPTEKPILDITYDDIGTYKDRFVLSDRVRLFLYHLWTSMGNDNYDKFLNKLFQCTSIDYQQFEKLVTTYLPNYKTTLHLWLRTNEYPKELHLKK